MCVLVAAMWDTTSWLLAAEAQPVPLREIAKAKLPDTFAALPPWRCDFEGRAYVRVRSWTGTQVMRLNHDLTPGQLFPKERLVYELKDFGIVDYAPDPDGGLFAVVGKRKIPKEGFRFRIAHFGDDGSFGGFVPVEGIVPAKIAVFANGNLLVSGPKIGTVDGQPISHWITNIIRPDGTFDVEVKINPNFSFALERKPDDKKPSVAHEEIEDAIEFLPSQNGNVYAAVVSSVDAPDLSSQNRLIEITPAGEVHFYTLSSSYDAELFRVVIDTNRLLTLYGTKSGEITDLREFFIDQTSRKLQLVGQYRVVGAPRCMSNDELIVERPDGIGRQWVVVYKH
jgi:hypothetical protein